MEDQNLSGSQGITEISARPSVFSSIFKIFYEPSSLFSILTKKTDWILPLVIFLVIGIGVGYLIKPIIMDHQFKGQMKVLESYREQLPPERYEQIVQQVEEQMAKSSEFKWYHLLIAVGFIAGIMLIITLVSWLTGSFIWGSRANFWLVLNVVAFAALIGLLGDVIRSLMIYSKGSMDVFTGLGLLKSTVGGESFLFYLFRQIDLFSVWRIIATCIGLGVIYKLDVKKFALVIFPVWCVFIALVAIANTFVGGTIIY